MKTHFVSAKRFVWMLIFGLFCMQSCKKSIEADDTLQEDYSLTQIWQYKQPNASYMRVVYNNFGDVLVGSNGANGFELLDATTGVSKWKWQDGEPVLLWQEYSIINTTMVMAGNSGTYAFDVRTGETVWKYPHDTVDLGGYSFYRSIVYIDENNYLYRAFKLKDGTDDIYIYRTQYDRLNWEKVCSISDSALNISKKELKSIVVSQNSKGEPILVCDVVDYTNHDFYRICGFNLVTKKFDWVLDETLLGVFDDEYLVAKQGKVFLQSNKYLLALGLDEGKILWKRPGLTKSIGNKFLYQNLIIVVQGGFSVEAYDQESGAIRWSFPIMSSKSSGNIYVRDGALTLFKHYLFITTEDELFVIDASTGKLLHDKDVPYVTSANVAVDPSKRLLYTQNGMAVNCYRLPESIR
jgi:outer membrane protein assembly factor BamB